MDLWFKIVVNILIALSNEEVPFKCKVTIKKSTEGPDALIDKGGYIVQPVPAPAKPNSPEAYMNVKYEQGSNQKDKAFNLGKAISYVISCRVTK
jgi:hypothetical protein